MILCSKVAEEHPKQTDGFGSRFGPGLRHALAGHGRGVAWLSVGIRVQGRRDHG